MDKKIRVVRSQNLAGALAWLGYYYTRDKDGNFIFERSYGFDLAFKALHSTRHYYQRSMWEKPSVSYEMEYSFKLGDEINDLR